MFTKINFNIATIEEDVNEKIYSIKTKHDRNQKGQNNKRSQNYITKKIKKHAKSRGNTKENTISSGKYNMC